MNRYEWQADSALKSVAIRHDQVYPTAYIVASDAANTALYKRLPEQLCRAGLQCVADEFEGKPALRVTGFKYDQQVIQYLQQTGFTKALPTLTEREPEKPFNAGEWVKENSAVAAGLTYLVADGMQYVSGALRKDNNNKAMAGFFASTSVLLTWLGTPDPNRQMERIYRKFDDYMKREGLPLEEVERRLLSERSEDRGNMMRRLTNFLSDHLTTINNLGQGIGGYQALRAGMNQQNKFKSASGVAIMTGQWGALGIEEDPLAGMNDQEKEAYYAAQREGKKADLKKIDPLQDPGTWLKQKPLRLTTLGAGLHNILTLIGGFREQMKPKDEMVAFQSQRGAHLDMGAQGVNIVANTLYGMSPRDRSGFLKEEGYVDELTSVAAQIFCHSQGPERAARVSQFVGFMSSMPETKSSAQEIYKAIVDKMEKLEQNPWHSASHQHAHAEPKPLKQVQSPVSREFMVAPEAQLAL